jgi:hypothetical protein
MMFIAREMPTHAKYSSRRHPDSLPEKIGDDIEITE